MNKLIYFACMIIPITAIYMASACFYGSLNTSEWDKHFCDLYLGMCILWAPVCFIAWLLDAEQERRKKFEKDLIKDIEEE